MYFLSHLPCYKFILVSIPTIFVLVLFVQFIRLHVISPFFYHHFCHHNLRYTFHVTFVKPLYFSMATAFAVAPITIVFVYFTFRSLALRNKTMNHNTDSTDKYSLTKNTASLYPTHLDTNASNHFSMICRTPIHGIYRSPTPTRTISALDLNLITRTRISLA